MKVKIVTAIKDDFAETVGPSQTTHAFLSLDGMLFEIGRFYEGPHMNEETGKRLAKVLEFERICRKAQGRLFESKLAVRSISESINVDGRDC